MIHHLQHSGLCGSARYFTGDMWPPGIPTRDGMGNGGALHCSLFRKWPHRGEKPHMVAGYADNTHSDVLLLKTLH